MNIVFHDGGATSQLHPLTALRPAADLTVGNGSISDIWAHLLKPERVAYAMSAPFSTLFTQPRAEDGPALHLLGALLPKAQLAEQLAKLKPGEGLFEGTVLLGACLKEPTLSWEEVNARVKTKLQASSEVDIIARPWDLFLKAEQLVEIAMAHVDSSQSQPISQTVTVLGSHRIYLAPGARVEACTLNASQGPIFIGQNAEIMEGASIRGPFALDAHSTIKMGARIYGPTVIGQHCKVGGEVSNCVIQNYSNKAHDGYLGNSTIGSWCNLGAGTNCSNLKNTYAPVRVYNPATHGFEQTGLQFCGLIMGDHSKSGINTMFNTGTLVEPFCNIFGAGFPRPYLRAFTWGGATSMRPHPLKDALETARVVMARRGLELTAAFAEAVSEYSELVASASD